MRVQLPEISKVFALVFILVTHRAELTDRHYTSLTTFSVTS